jgi:hypothetical protein
MHRDFVTKNKKIPKSESESLDKWFFQLNSLSNSFINYNIDVIQEFKLKLQPHYTRL